MTDILTEGLAQLGLPTGAAPRLTEFAGAVLEKNKVMNLTAITDPADFAALHLLDSAVLLTIADFRGKKAQCAVSHEVRRRGQGASRGAPGKSGLHA